MLMLIFALAALLALGAGVWADISRSSSAEVEPRSSVSRGLAPFPVDASILPRIQALAQSIADSNNDPTPSDARVFRTTRTTATKALDDSVADSHQPVYVVILHGDFVALGAPRPPDAPEPRGRELYFVWDPVANVVTDFGLGNDSPDLARLGSGVPLDLGVAPSTTR
jgi:hypothetical protein